MKDETNITPKMVKALRESGFKYKNPDNYKAYKLPDGQVLIKVWQKSAMFKNGGFWNSAGIFDNGVLL